MTTQHPISADDARDMEQTFFNDPALDRVLAFTLSLAAEVWMLRDGMKAMEHLLVESGLVKKGALDAIAAVDRSTEWSKDREAFVRHLMDNLLGIELSKGAPADRVQ